MANSWLGLKHRIPYKIKPWLPHCFVILSRLEVLNSICYFVKCKFCFLKWPIAGILAPGVQIQTFVLHKEHEWEKTFFFFEKDQEVTNHHLLKVEHYLWRLLRASSVSLVLSSICLCMYVPFLPQVLLMTGLNLKKINVLIPFHKYQMLGVSH